MREAVLADLVTLVRRVRGEIASPGLLYLVGRTSHLAEAWCDFSPRVILAGEPEAGPQLRELSLAVGASMGLDVAWESPVDVIPLPPRWAARALPAPPAIRFREGRLDVRHFDPYSVVLRLIARGDESDYVESVEYITRGWVIFERLEALVAEVLPHFTSETLAQDPAEFRRKFRGLRQLCRGGPAELRYASAVAETAWV